METGLKNYIKNMFAMSEAPTWDSSYEGTIFYDKVAKSWITGNNDGWQRLDRSTTSVAPFTAIDWVDPFEYPTDEIINSNYIVNDMGTMPGTLTAKSVVFDIADNWGGSGAILCREVDFYLNGTKLELTTTDYTVYGSAHSSPYAVANLFDTTTSLIGAHPENGWQQNISSNTRVIIVFNTPQQFNNIIVTNGHDDGALTTYSIQNVKITMTTTTTETLLTYNAPVTGGIVIFDDVFNQHSAINEPDSQTLVLQNIPEAITTFNISSENNVVDLTKSVIFDMTDNYGDASYMGIRSIEFTSGGELIELSTYDFTAYATNSYDPYYKAEMAFDTSLTKIGGIDYTTWQTQTGNSAKRLIIVFDAPIFFDGITVNNLHHSGTAFTNRGVKNMIVNTSSDEITDTTYNAAISKAILIFDSYITQHTNVDEVDDQILSLIPPETNSFVDTITYGNYSLKGTAISGSLGSSITKIMTPELSLAGKDLLAFDIASSRVGTNLSIELITNSLVLTKSVIVDIANDYGGAETYMSIRSIEFIDENDNIIPLTTGFTAYASSLFSGYTPAMAFNTGLLKTGSWANSSWISAQESQTNQRLICVFDSPYMIKDVVINNGHHLGNYTLEGAKNIKIYFSTDIVTSTIYNDGLTNSNLVFDGEIAAHVTNDVVDDQILNIISTILEVHTINITTPNTFQKEIWDVSTLSGTYEQLMFSIINDDLENTFYIDNMRFEEKELEIINWIDPFEYPTDEILNNNYIVTTAQNYITAKSVILDITDNYVDATWLSIRSIEFKLNGELIELLDTDFTSYETTAHSSTYYAKNIFDTSLSKTGSNINNSWLATSPNITNQRLICVLNIPITFDSIVVNNAFAKADASIATTRGAKNVRIYTSSDNITSTIYEETISNAYLIFDGVFSEHSAANEVDDQILALQDINTSSILSSEDVIKTYGNYSLKAVAGINSSVNDYFSKILTPVLDTTDINNIQFDVRSSRVGTNIQLQLSSSSIEYSAKSIILEYSDNWGDGTYSQIRSIEFYYKGTLVSLTNSTDFTAYGLFYAVSTEVWRIFDTSLSKTGVSTNNGWVSTSGGSSNRRLVCVFNSSQTFDSIVVNNGHHSGTANTTRGIKTTKITISDDEITNTTYEAIIANSTVIFDGIIEQHVAIDQIDDQVIPINAGSSESILTHDINIQASDVFQTEVWDVTTLSGGYNTLTFKILNDDLENTFYIDNMTKY